MNIITWKGKSYASYSEIIDAALEMDGDDQKAFVRAVCATGPYARQNIGYFAGYYSHETAQRIYRAFETAHPIFGTTTPTPEEAFDLGVKLGKTAKKAKAHRPLKRGGKRG